MFGTRHVFRSCCGFANSTPTSLAPGYPLPDSIPCLCPHSSVYMRYRNFNLLSIDYVFRPRLRSRLTQSRSALLWKPWIFGRKDSHLPLATHSGILSSYPSTAPYRYSFVGFKNAPLPLLTESTASVLCFSPGHFRRRDSRLVSCYALFECMAASEPTS